MADIKYPSENVAAAGQLKYPTTEVESAEIKYPTQEVATAPEVKLRPHMVDSAVRFLLHRDMQHSSLKSKKTFLLRKGLTNEEIEEAIHQAQLTFQMDLTQQADDNDLDSGSQYGRWSALIVLFGAASIGLYKLYQLYILPFLLGQDNKKIDDVVSHDITSRNQQITELNERVTELQKQTEHYKTSVTELVKEESQKYSNQVREVHEEVKSVKKLLLNRSQFPATPVQKPIIPSWQLEAETKPPPTSDSSTAEPAAENSTAEPAAENSPAEPAAENSTSEPTVVNGTEPETNQTIPTNSLPSLNTNGSHDVIETDQSDSDTDTSYVETENKEQTATDS